MSLFRSPNDISSSTEDTSFLDDDDNDDENHDYTHQDHHHRSHSSHTQDGARSSFDDDISGSFEGVLENKDPETSIAGFDAESHATMMTTALLEYYCLTRATEILNEKARAHQQQQPQQWYTRDSPEARLLGRRLYAHKSQFLAANGVLAAGVDGDDWEMTRKYYRDSLDVLGLSALEGLDLGGVGGAGAKGVCSPPLPSPQAVLGAQQGKEQLPLGLEPSNNIKPDADARRPAFRRLLTAGNEVGFHDQLPTPLGFLRPPTLQSASYFPLMTLAGAPYQPSPLASRYTTEFEELSLIGRGSYGVVYKAMHYVDGQYYAIKKIPLSPRRIKQLQDRGLQELDHILKEIRTLARLDHGNVVRYYGAWAEYNAAVKVRSRSPTVAANRPPLALLNEKAATTTEEESSHGIVFEESSNGLVVEESDHGIVFEEDSSKDEGSTTGDVLSSSSSARPQENNTRTIRESRKSFVESYGGEDEDDDEVESIGRRFSHLHQSQATSTSELDGDIFTDGAGGNNSVQPDPKTRFGGGGGGDDGRGRGRSGTVSSSPITLHIQMSLHPLSLAKYLRPPPSDELSMVRQRDSPPQHCYHLVPSIKIILGILSGVEYLHSQGIVHRDLKPANVFLSLSTTTTTTRARDETGCPACETAGGGPGSHYTIPRIGDFGLVADTSPGADPAAASSPTTTTANRPVGTEFYRPPLRPPCNHPGGGGPHTTPHADKAGASCGCSSDRPSKLQVDESLDVYALGVILFELLYKLDTRMERQMVLSDLTCSPNGFGWAQRTAGTTGDISAKQARLPADFTQRIDGGGAATVDGRQQQQQQHEEQQQGIITGASVAERIAFCILKMVEPDRRQRWTCREVRECLEGMLSLVSRRA
ncbi:hypothetical protein LOZ53_006711 [Ophidiomyces ophidiicola]|nr:hypothetical protein LOZ55_002575 [Ophidiomyces ophidiicola]KAI1979931.1 hypothetical protein LOZ53_006711 [Ophidiomyces ophidiicola]KAI1991949.1 hypothetical protein LOZ51_004539 [Ophidiomyces ophidiicola]